MCRLLPLLVCVQGKPLASCPRLRRHIANASTPAQYLFLLVIDTPPATETGGLFYPKALQHIFVGLYIEEVCLAGLFFLAQDDQKKNIGIPQGALMVVLIVMTVGFHLTINAGYGPLINYLPLSVAPKIAALQHETLPEHTESRTSEEKKDQSSE